MLGPPDVPNRRVALGGGGGGIGFWSQLGCSGQKRYHI